jgi:hypothetical protein
MKTIESLQRSQTTTDLLLYLSDCLDCAGKRQKLRRSSRPTFQTQCPELATDFKLLAEELMPHFRELDANALQLQNEFRREQVLLIFGAALASARPKRMGSINVTRISCQ